MKTEQSTAPTVPPIVNVVVKAILRSPLHGLMSKNRMLLTFRGHKSGKLYTTPLSYLHEGESIMCFTDSSWWKNLRGGAPVRVRLAGRDLAGYDHCPVSTYVIYLRKGGEVAKSPFIRKGAEGEEAHRFHFRVIKLWEVPAEVMLQTRWVGLLPLVTLTWGGKRPEVVKVMIDTLVAAGETDLLAMARLMGGLAFQKKEEREWFNRRFRMFQDILRESWVYQEIGQEFLEEGRLEGQREALMSFVQMRFAEVTDVAKQQIDGIKDLEVLQAVTRKLFAAQTVEEAKRILFESGKH